MGSEWLRLSASSTLVEVDIQPSAKRSEAVGIEPWRGRLKVAVRAPPADGEANAELIEVVARILGIKRAEVSIVAGLTSRRKTLRIEGDHIFALRLLVEAE